MFIQKDLFEADGGADRTRQQYPASGPGFGNSRPGTANTSGGTTVPGSVSAAPDEQDECAVPGSVVNMRAKMMQQRERQLAKQRSSGLGGGSMVMANQGQPAAEPTSPTGFRRANTGPAPLLGSPTALSASGSVIASIGSSTCAFAGPTSDDAPDDDGGQGAVMPVAPVISKEEEEARRKQLQEELSQRGIAPEFDPTSGTGPGPRPTFDPATIQPHEMRSFLHMPLPKTAGVLQCRVVRDRNGITSKLRPKYMFESESGVFFMAAQKQVKNKTSNYAISMCKSASSKESAQFLGKLRSDFLGIEWSAYGPGMNPAKCDVNLSATQLAQLVREELLAVQYAASKWGASSKGPRKMTVAIPVVQASGERLVCKSTNPQHDGLLPMLKQTTASPMIEVYTNKDPKWNDQIGAYVLNFNKRVTEASVKNFQLINAKDPETVYLQFGRVGKEVFNLDFRHPISPFQAFAMCLSSFDYKLGCE